EIRDETVREREHLRRRAIVLLQAHDERVREAPRHVEQVLRAGARERVDRLVVVADDAEVVAFAEPEVEQRLLEQVDVLYSSTVNARYCARNVVRASASRSNIRTVRS